MRLSIPLLTMSAALFTASLCDAGGPWGQANAPYSAGYAPFTAAYAPSAAVPVVRIAPAGATAPVAINGAYQAQRPAYFDNPSVYTGLPVTGNVQTTYRAPLAGTYRGAAPVYPTVTYQAGYAAAYSGATVPGSTVPGSTVPAATYAGQSTTVVSPIVAPMTTIPVAAPVYPSTPPPRSCCLSRFCQSLFGTSYTTSYYRAPVTYYRPVTTISPVSGTAVTVQQPCTAYEQQVQRTPYTTLQHNHPSAAPASSCPSNCSSPSAAGSCSVNSPYGQAVPYGAVPFGASPNSGIGQVGAISSGDQQPVPIPTMPPPGNGAAVSPNLSPLLGAPPTLAPPTLAPPTSAGSPTIAPPAQGNSQSSNTQSSNTQSSNTQSSDSSPVGQPSLNTAPQTESLRPKSDESSTERPPSYWKLQNAEDSTAMIPSRKAPTWQSQPDPVSLSASGGSNSAVPIRAPSDYVAPYGRAVVQPTAPVSDPASSRRPFPPTAPVTAPPLPPPSYNPADVTSVSNPRSTSVRDVSYQRRNESQQRYQAPRQRSTQPRDTTWVKLRQ